MSLGEFDKILFVFWCLVIKYRYNISVAGFDRDYKIFFLRLASNGKGNQQRKDKKLLHS